MSDKIETGLLRQLQEIRADLHYLFKSSSIDRAVDMLTVSGSRPDEKLSRLTQRYVEFIEELHKLAVELDAEARAELASTYWRKGNSLPDTITHMVVPKGQEKTETLTNVALRLLEILERYR